MRLQDQIVRQTQRSLDDLVRAVTALPPERRDWSPGGAARSALAQMREVAETGNRFIPLIMGDATGFEGHAAREEARLSEDEEGLEQAIARAREGVNELCQAIAGIPDAALERELELPFGGGMRMTLADVLGLPAWNLAYHLGQVNQIALMLGDRNMH